MSSISSDKEVEVHTIPDKIVAPVVPFWTQDPNVLFQSWQFFPVPASTENENLNAITRSAILLTLLGFLATGRLSVVLVGVLTVFFLFVYHYLMQIKRKRESFENPSSETTLLEELRKNPPELVYDTPTPLNPFCNVLNSDIQGNPNKPPAPPIDNPSTQAAILQAAKDVLVQSHPNFPDIDQRLLQNLGDLYEFEQSLQPFYVNPGTTIPNDQNSFAEFCYGSMISCKEGNLFACARNNAGSHYNNY
jgi:hypothetical protein